MDRCPWSVICLLMAWLVACAQDASIASQETKGGHVFTVGEKDDHRIEVRACSSVLSAGSVLYLTVTHKNVGNRAISGVWPYACNWTASAENIDSGHTTASTVRPETRIESIDWVA